jgi:hypothetical protein
VEEEDRETQDEELPDLCEPRKNLTCYAWLLPSTRGSGFLLKYGKTRAT